MSNPDIIVNQNIISQQEIPGFKYLPPEEAAFETKPQEKRPPDPLEIRIASMEMITSNALSRIPRLTIHTLSADIPIETKEAELVKNEAGNPQRALSYLNYLLRNQEAADLLSRLHPQREYDTGALIKLTDDWKSATIQVFKTPRKPLPERIVDQADKQQYLCAVVPLRPGLNQALEYFKKATRQSQIFMFASRTTGLDQTDELVEDWARYTHRGELSGLSQKGAEAIESAAEIALSLSDGNPSMRKETIESIKSVIQAQDKWSVVAEDGLDPLTQNLLSLLVKNHEPEAVTIILDTLRRRIIQDENFTASMLFPSDEFMLHAEITLKPTIDWCLNLALQTDKQAVVKYAGDHLYDRGMAFYLVDLIA